MAKFPKAPVNDTKAEDPMMKRVDMHHGEIGSRTSGMPKSMDTGNLSLNHVGDSNRQK